MLIKVCIICIIIGGLILPSCTNSNGSDEDHEPDVTKNQDAQIDGSLATDRVSASSFISDVCVSNRRVYTAWLDSRDGDRNVYFNARAEDRGWTHGNDIRLNPQQIGAELNSVKICASKNGKYVHVVWSDDAKNQKCIYYSYSDNFGYSFSSPIPISPEWPFPYPSSDPQICCSQDGFRVFIVYRYGRSDIGFAYSGDAGVSWSPTPLFVNTDTVGGYLADYPSIDCSDDGHYCHIAWLDYRKSFYIYHRAWDMNTQSWVNDDQAVSDGRANYPLLKCNKDGQIVHIIWSDLTGSLGVYHDISTDWGMSWGTDEEISTSNDDDNSDHGSLTCNRDTGDICVIWIRSIDPGKHTWTVFSRSTVGGTWQTEVEVGISYVDADKNSYDIPHICCLGQQVFALWTDSRDMPQRRVYYNTSTNFGVSWIGTGMPLNTPGIEQSYRTTNPKIACDASGMVYGVWGEARGSTIPQIYGRFIQDRATNINADKQENLGPGNSQQPHPTDFRGDEKIPHSGLVPSHAWQSQFLAYQNHVYGVWLSDRNGFQDVYLTHSGDNGFNWQNDFLINNAPGEIAQVPLVASDTNDNIVYVAWEYPDHRVESSLIYADTYFDRYLYRKRGGLQQIVTVQDKEPQPKKPRNIAQPHTKKLQNTANNPYYISRQQEPMADKIEYLGSYSKKNRANIANSKEPSRSQQIAVGDYSGEHPIMKADDYGAVYVMFQLDDSWNINPIFVAVSNNYGNSWQGNLAGEQYISDYVNYDITFADQYVYLIQEQRWNTGSTVRFSYSQDSGITWTTPIALDANSTLSRNPCIYAKDSQVFVSWLEYQSNDLAQVYYVYSNDYGTTFSAPGPIESKPSTVIHAAELAIAGTTDTLYATWTGYHPLNKTKQIYFGRMKLENGSPVLINAIKLSDIASSATHPAIVCDGNTLYVAWQDTYYGKSDIFGRHSYDAGQTWSSVYRFNTNTAGISYAIKPKLQITPAWVHCIWQDYRYGLNVFYEQRPR